MQNTKRTKWLKALRPLTLLLVITFLLSYITYSWIRREWTLTIEQNDMVIATGGSLVFQFDDEASTGKTVNEILGVEDFELKPVSNISGASADFFNINFLMGEGNEYFQNLTRTGAQSYTDLGILNGYVEMRFMLLCPGEDTSTRYVYLSPDSKIVNAQDIGRDVASCIRVSITVDENNGVSDGTTYLFGCNSDGTPKTHRAITNEKDENGYIANGAPYYSDTDVKNDSVVVDYTENDGKLHSFSEFNGGQDTSDNTEFTHDLGKVLFATEGGSKRWITVRIWLEGEDPLCTDEITGSEIDLMIKFSSFT